VLKLFSRLAEPTFAVVVVFQGRQEFFASKFRPWDGRNMDFGVGGLQQEEIAEALFAGGSNDQVGLGLIRSIEM